MNVSRPTFTRIYNNALKQKAKAFIEGKAIEIEGRNYEMDKEWYTSTITEADDLLEFQNKNTTGSSANGLYQ